MSDETVPVKMLQVYSEFRELLKIYCKLKPIYVVEIGSFQGGTLWHWLKYAQPGAQVISIDPGPKGWKEVHQDFDKGIWQSWVPEGVTLHTIIGKSGDREVLASVRKICPRIDFLFIDGDHRYESVKRDYDDYGGLVQKGGVIALHDIVKKAKHPYYGVWRLFAHLKRKYRTEQFVKMKPRVGSGIGVIYR